MTTARRINGTVLDVASAAGLLGVSQKCLRARVARGLVPYRRFSGRIVFVRSELEQYVSSLPGVTLEEARRNVAQRLR